MSSGRSANKSANSKHDTKDKEKSKPSGSIYDFENQFILRIPEPYCSKLQNDLQSCTLKDKLKIDLHGDNRTGTVKYHGKTFSAKLFNLPCVAETWKTLDRKSFWKTADIGQVLVCKDFGDSDESSSEEEEDVKNGDPFKKHQQGQKKFQYPHGLTPPLKNARKRRFRKTAKKKYIEAPEIEKEVKRLLRADISAVDVTYEVLQDEDKQDDARSNTSDLDVGNSLVQSPANFNEESLQSPASYNQNEEANAILPDISSSEDDIDMNEDTNDYSNEHDLSKDDIMMAGGVQGSEEILRRISELQSVLIDVQAKRTEQESRVENASNPFLKQRFQASLDNLIQREQIIRNELDELQQN
eukprot:gene8079-8944_t